MSPLKISIITISLNSQKYLEGAINSVLSQEYPNLEYIIIDGGSSDGTVDIIKKYQDKLAYWKSEPDHGIYDAMNKGIAKATGDIIGMINSDDYYFPGSFQKVADAFADKSLDSHIFWGDIAYKKGIVFGWRPHNLKIGAFAPHPSMFCPKKIYNRIGVYNPKLRVLGDYDFMYRAINAAGIKPIYLPEPVAFFRAGGFASRNVLLSLSEELEVKLKYGQNFFFAFPVFLFKVLKNIKKILDNQKLLKQ